MAEQHMPVPAGFEALAGLGEWNMMTADERAHARKVARPEALRHLYDTVLPHLEAILDECDRFPLGELPESHHGIFNLALMMAEIAPHVEFYRGQTDVPYSFDEARFIAVHGKDETWRALPPNGPR
jgi:hypothetical protein